MIYKSDKMSDDEEEEKNSKTEKDVEKVDKEFLSKAKNSRDMIDKKLRTFENTITDISKTKEDKEKNKEDDKKEKPQIQGDLNEVQIQFESISKKIDDKKDYLSALEEKIAALEESYNRKIEENTTIEDQLKITGESKETLDEEYKELLRNNEQLVKTYENRQVDLIVLTDSIKEKVTTQDDLRSKIAKLNKEVEENVKMYRHIK